MRSDHHVVLATRTGFRGQPRLGSGRGALLGPLLAAGALGLYGCSGDFHSDNGFDDMTCDSSGCYHCDRGSCEEYNCAATHQCPMDRTCSADGRCVVGSGGGGEVNPRCDSHDDCGAGQICTLEGRCVATPGGGPGKDASDTSDAAAPDGVDDATPDTTVDTGPGEVGLPDHPDDVCRTNADCGVDGTCVNGGCYFPCTIDGKCPPGQACGAGQCRAAAPENQCTFNGECGTTHACLEGTCYQRCEETLDCLVHTRCSTGICVADTTPVIQCSGAGSCGANKSCVDGKCLEACVDGACGAGLACDLGYCIRTASCFASADCGGNDCIDGACAP